MKSVEAAEYDYNYGQERATFKELPGSTFQSLNWTVAIFIFLVFLLRLCLLFLLFIIITTWLVIIGQI